jgi:hypothetical protein
MYSAIWVRLLTIFLKFLENRFGSLLHLSVSLYKIRLYQTDTKYLTLPFIIKYQKYNYSFSKSLFLS